MTEFDIAPQAEERNLSIIPEIGLTEIDGEPRARDIEIAERLGMSRPRDIRQLIERNLAEIEGFGPARRRTALADRPQGGGSSTEEYWLSEEQALLVAALSKAPHAPAVRAMLIRCFVAWRRGHLASAPVAPVVSPAALEEITRTFGIVRSTIHKVTMMEKELAALPALTQAVTALTARVQPSVPGVVIRHGKTAGAILKAAGFTGCPKNLAVTVGNWLEAAGCRVEGHMDTGVCRARLFDPDKAEAWFKSGGKLAVEQKLAERKEQGALVLAGAAHRTSNPPAIPPGMEGDWIGAIMIDGAPVYFDARDTEITQGDKFVVIAASGDVRIDTPRKVGDNYRPFGSRTVMCSPQMEAVPGRRDPIPVEWMGAILGKVVERRNVIPLPAHAS